MAQQDVLDYIRKTPHNSNVNVVKGMLSVEEDSGDSSEFSSAEVTLANNPDFAGGVPYCASLDGMNGVVVNTLGDGTYTVPLWKGHLCLIFENTTATVTGDAALIYDGMAVDVYGDCTITKVS